MKRTKFRWGVVALLFFATTINYMDRAILGISAPDMMNDLGLSPVEFGLLGSAFFWTYTLMQIPLGSILDKIGAKMTYTIAIIWWSVCTILTGFGKSVGALIGIRALMGIGEAPAFPTNTRVINDWLPSKERGVANGVFMMGIAVGAGLTTPIIAWIVESYGWRISYIIMGIVGLCWVPFWMKIFKNKPSESKMNEAELKHIQDGMENKQADNAPKIKWYEILKIRNVWICAFGLFCQNYMNYMILTWLPTYLVQARGMTLMNAGFSTMIPWIVAACGAFLGGLTSDGLIRKGWGSVKARRAVLSGGTFVSLSIIPAAFVESNVLALAFISLALGGMMFASSGVWSILTDLVPSDTIGTAAGFQNFVGNFAGVIAPAATGAIVVATGSFVSGLVLSGILIGIASLSYFFFLKEEKNGQGPSNPPGTTSLGQMEPKVTQKV